MKIAEIGRVVRRQRKRLDLVQVELASLAGVGNRFISDLENGKAGLEIGRVLKVLAALGLEVVVQARTWDSLDAGT
jgi:HTH-type transcriptional regulator / antitoxin HipB